jgi:D-alanyl-D-alanine carboxypeptidase
MHNSAYLTCAYRSAVHTLVYNDSTGMDDFNPHSFDTRGFLFGISCLVAVVAIFGAVKYGTVVASEYIIKESQAAQSVKAATDEDLATLREKNAAEAAKVLPLTHISIGDKLPPHVSARTYFVGDMNTGVVYAQKNVGITYPIASISKLFTALAAKELLSPTSTVAVTDADRRGTEGSPGSIQVNDSFSVQDLFYPLLTESNNSVANALARAAGKEIFLEKMREIADEAGMTGSMFEDPSGLSENNATNAVDIFLLTRHIYREAPDLLEITRARGDIITAESGRTYSFSNFNVFYDNPNFVGGKTGYTSEARQTMTTVFDVSLENATTTIAIIVLGSDNRQQDINALLRWFKSAVKVSTSTPH